MIDLNKDKEFITKQALLKHIQDIEVYQKYFYGDVVIKGKPQMSPFRKENHPSFGFFQGESGEICFNDLKIGGGDFVRFVQMKYGLTYFEALSKIATDFGLSNDYICKKFDKEFLTTNERFPTREEVLSKVTGFEIGKRQRKWLIHDVMYWQQFGIGIETLRYFNVEPIDMYFINCNPWVADKHAYCFTENKDGKVTYKIYQPFNEQYKWINNHNDSVWQGWEQLPNTGSDLIITKSLKDVMSIYEVCKLPAVALQSENVLPKIHVFEQLDSRFDSISLLYDNDFDSEINWGRKFGDKLSVYLQLPALYIPDEYKCKDFSDLVKGYGKDIAKKVLQELRDSIPF